MTMGLQLRLCNPGRADVNQHLDHTNLCCASNISEGCRLFQQNTVKHWTYSLQTSKIHKAEKEMLLCFQ